MALNNWSHHDSAEPSLEFSTMQSNEISEVTEFMLKNFFREEPLGKSLGLDTDKEVRPWLTDLLKHVVQEGISIIVRNRALHSDSANDVGEIVGVCINDVERRDGQGDDVNISTFVRQESHPMMWQITSLLDVLMADRDLLNRFQIDTAVNLQMLSVSPDYGGRGIARKLIVLTEELSRRMGHSLIFSEATSKFSAQAFFKAGFISDNTISYGDFTLCGAKPFSHMSGGIHNEAQLMIKMI